MIAAGENHNLYVADDERVYSSGNHLHGQLGCGEEEQKSETQAMLVRGIDVYQPKVIQISCGSDHSFALLSTGQVYSWGLNFKGQLGHGDVEN